MIQELKILNPKRNSKTNSDFYNYYAGFSSEFASTVIKSIPKDKVTILDPWNGSGTTTKFASKYGHKAIGIDLNPVMAISAKANLLSSSECPSIWPITFEITTKALRKGYTRNKFANDPLAVWFVPSSIHYIRRIEYGIQELLIDPKDFDSMGFASGLSNLSSLSCFYYVALFKTVRSFLSPFKTSNPTWIKKPKDLRKRLKPSLNSVIKSFHENVKGMIDVTKNEIFDSDIQQTISDIQIGSSLDLKVETGSIDFILSSPPYCTRIDYAVATMPELAVLGYNKDLFDNLRKALMGTSTVQKGIGKQNEEWGKTCNNFLGNLYNHSSKASRSYYYKNHLQYFDALYNSLGNLSRVLKNNGTCLLVVQDSYYKNLHNNVPEMLVEMGGNLKLSLQRRHDFQIKRNMAGINIKSRKYRINSSAIESILCFSKS